MKKILFLSLLFVLAIQVNAQNLDDAQNLLKQSTRSIEFIENKGQVADQNGNVNFDVLFIAEVPYGTVVIRKDGISCSFVKRDENVLNKNKFNSVLLSNTSNQFERFDEKIEPIPTEIYRVDMRLKGSNKNPQIEALEKIEDYNNYYLAHCPEGITNVRKYKTIKLKDVYPNIDFVIYANSDGNVQYDFVIKPGGNPKQINFRYEGASYIKIATDGSLICETPFGKIEQKAPVAYQLYSLGAYTNSRNFQSKRNSLPLPTSQFKINKDQSISFLVSNYNPQIPLIIDPPTRLWGTDRKSVV